MATKTIVASPALQAEKAKSAVSVFVLIDALGWRYLEGKDFLNDILPYRRSLRTVLGFSSGAIPTILTGTMPNEHGHWNLFYYDPKNSPFKWLRYFRWLPDSLLDTRVSRKIVKEMGKRFLGCGPLFDCFVTPRLMPYFNWVEKRNIYHRRGISGAPSIFDRLTESGIPYRVYTFHEATDNEILGQAERDIRAGPERVFFLYLSEMDMFLHMHCKRPEAIDEKIRLYDAGLRRVFAAAREISPEATFAVFSDHGMTPVTNHYDLVGAIEKLQLRMPQDYLSVFDSTMARFWFFSERGRAEILNLLSQVSCGRVLSDAELRAMGILFDDRRYGETILLLNPGWLFAKSDFESSRWAPAGMHGYDPADGYSDAIFLSNRKPEHEVTTIRDVFRCMWAAAGEGQ